MIVMSDQLALTDYAGWGALCRAEARKHCRRAWNFAGFRGASIIVSAVLAAVAAVTSATGTPTWITTASAGLSAALGVVTAGFGPSEKNIEHRALAANFDRAAAEFALAEEWKAPSGRWTVEIERIVGELRSNRFEDKPERWAAARVPEPPSSRPAPA